MRQLTLHEYQTELAVELSIAEWDSLREIVPSLSITPSVGRQGCYDLKPGSHVGAVDLGSLSVVILPKIPLSRTMHLVLMNHDVDHYATVVLTPPLTPLRALHAETLGNHQ